MMPKTMTDAMREYRKQRWLMIRRMRRDYKIFSALVERWTDK